MASRVSNQVNFAVTPEWVLFADISANAVRLYGVLNRHADKDLKARPSRKRVADLMHVSPSTVDRSLDELVRIGAVTVKERYERAPGSDERRQTSNWYILNAVPQGAAQMTLAEPSQAGDPLVTREQGGLGTRDDPPLVTREQGKNESPSELEPPTPAERGIESASLRPGGKNPRTLGTNPRAVAEREAEERRQRQAGCQTCDGMGVVPTDDDGATPCPDCREVKAS